MNTKPLWSLAAAGLFASLACAGGDSKNTSDSSAGASTPSTSNGVDLTGAGATFPYPIYAKWISDYLGKTGVKINYQQIGSGGGSAEPMPRTPDAELLQELRQLLAKQGSCP